jgi:trans-aconitate 2-methyltransferase
MRQLAESERWAPQLSGVLRQDDASGEPSDYLKILLDAGFEPDVWETTYGQILSGPDPVLEWVRGTALRPVLARLSATDAADFEAQYGALVSEAYPAVDDHGGGTVTLFPFRRIFMVGRKR